MKKLISILLTLALTLSLSTPALAAAPEEKLWHDMMGSLPHLILRDSGYLMDAETAAWLEAHPEEAAAMRVANFLQVSLDEIKTFARITGHDDIHDMDVDDLCTINREISEFTNISHA